LARNKAKLVTAFAEINVPETAFALSVSRFMKAAPALIFASWADGERLAEWWCPKPWTTHDAIVELQAGGGISATMRGPNGQEMPHRSVFLEVIPNKRIVFTDAFTSPWVPSGAAFMTALVELTPESSGTLVNVTVLHWSTEDRDRHRGYGFEAAWGAVLAQMEETALAIGQSQSHPIAKTERPALINAAYELSFTRIIKAPRHKVFRCWTEVELIMPWFCPKPWQVTEARVDLKAGGEFYTKMRGPNGEEPSGEPGIFLEVIKDKKIVFTDMFKPGWVPAGGLNFVAIVELDDTPDGQTQYTATVRHWTEAAMKSHEEMGFYDGWNAAADQLEAFANTI
jgi:uncharacterized protein YndB with AHSA1/START domain